MVLNSAQWGDQCNSTVKGFVALAVDMIMGGCGFLPSRKEVIYGSTADSL